MSRKRTFAAREIEPDPRYNSVIVSKFINTIMLKGKKSIAEKIVYTALENLGKKVKKDPLEIFYQALDNVKPLVKVVSRRIGGANYQVPTEVTERNAQAIAFRWIIQFARKRSEKTMSQRLTSELLAAYNKEGASIRKREETHRMAEANKAFSHLRF